MFIKLNWLAAHFILKLKKSFYDTNWQLSAHFTLQLTYSKTFFETNWQLSANFTLQVTIQIRSLKRIGNCQLTPHSS